MYWTLPQQFLHSSVVTEDGSLILIQFCLPVWLPVASLRWHTKTYLYLFAPTSDFGHINLSSKHWSQRRRPKYHHLSPTKSHRLPRVYHFSVWRLTKCLQIGQKVVTAPHHWWRCSGESEQYLKNDHVTLQQGAVFVFDTRHVCSFFLRSSSRIL